MLVRAGGDRLLIDCGEGAQRQMQRSTGLVQVDELYLTHYHADHYLGVPGLLKTYALNERERPCASSGRPGSDLFHALQRITGRVGYPIELVELGEDEPVRHERTRSARSPSSTACAPTATPSSRTAPRPLRPRRGGAPGRPGGA